MAQMPEARRKSNIFIPRMVLKGPAAGAGTIEGSARDALDAIKTYGNGNRQLRYAQLPDSDGKTNAEIEAKLERQFSILADMTQEVIEGRARALVVSGPGGVGKTHLMDEQLNEWDPTQTDWTSYSGYSTPVGLLRMLYAHRHEGHVIKADDLDSIFAEEKALNYLKGACDSTQQRVIRNMSEATLIDEETMEEIPKSFEFNAAMIFCTNLDFDQLIDKGSKLTPHFEALMTRSHYIDLGMRTKRHYLLRVFMVADQGLFDNVQGGALNEEESSDVLDFIEENYRILRECSLRMALKIGALRKGHRDTDKFGWREKALVTCCRGQM